ncbi:MAG TPA: hypothetical protein VFA12_13515 [Stellaceae bacterium]|nr:hypothetical protein [Stellaceae bacterium]
MSDRLREPAQPLSAEEIQNFETRLVAVLQEHDGHLGNTSLIQRLGWPEDRYWMIRDRLVDAGSLALGRGRGGSVTLIAAAEMLDAGEQEGQDAIRSAEPQAEIPIEYQREEYLYTPILNSLQSGYWKQNKRLDEFECEITARQGRRQTFGTWSRPDLTAVSMVTYSYVPGRHFDLFTFEVKSSREIDITAVYEALAHRRRATQSYVVYHCPDANTHDAILGDICEEASKHGIGIIVAENPADPKTWDERVEPTRNNPDPEKLDEFIRTTLPEQTRSQMLKWFR